MSRYNWYLFAACDDCGAPEGEACQRRRGYDASAPCKWRTLKTPTELRSDYMSDSTTRTIPSGPNLQDWEDIRTAVRRNWKLLKPYVDLFKSDEGEGESNQAKYIVMVLRSLAEHNLTLMRQVAQSNWAVLKPIIAEFTKELKRAELLESYGPDIYAAGTTITWSHKPKGTYEAEHISATKQHGGLWTLTENSQDRIQGTWEELAHDFWLRDDLMYQPNVYTAWERIGKGANRAQA